MKTAILRYQVVIRKEGKDFVADVPSLGISDFGKSLEQTKKNIQNAIRCHIEGLIKTQSEVPPPDTSDFYISTAEVSLPKNFKFAI